MIIEDQVVIQWSYTNKIPTCGPVLTVLTFPGIRITEICVAVTFTRHTRTQVVMCVHTLSAVTIRTLLLGYRTVDYWLHS